MSPTRAVFRRELHGYFGTPVAYVFLVVFLALGSFLTFRDHFFDRNEASLTVFFSQLPWLFALFAPAIAMRMWAEERRTGTIELLLTLPVTLPQAVLGKFLAGWVFFIIALLFTLPLVFTVAFLGDPEWGPIFTGYLGAALMAGSYLAISSFFSVITKNQVICFIISALACGFFVVAGWPSMINALSSFLPAPLLNFVESMSFLTHFDTMQRGVLEFGNLFFMFAVMAGFLLASCVMLDERKAQ